MDGYKHYAVTQSMNGQDVVIDGYTSGFPELAKVGGISILDDGPRSFYQQWGDIVNGKGQYRYKLVDGKMVERTEAEMFDIGAYKTAKLAELSTKCRQSILAGFLSVKGHTYPYDEEAQRNFTTAEGFTTRNPDRIIQFKTLDSGYIGHTSSEILAVIDEGAMHLATNLYKNNALRAQVNGPAIDTKEKVDAITWE